MSMSHSFTKNPFVPFLHPKLISKFSGIVSGSLHIHWMNFSFSSFTSISFHLSFSQFFPCITYAFHFFFIISLHGMIKVYVYKFHSISIASGMNFVIFFFSFFMYLSHRNIKRPGVQQPPLRAHPLSIHSALLCSIVCGCLCINICLTLPSLSLSLSLPRRL